LGIFEIILFLIIALIVIPPDDLPQVMRAVGKVMRELRLASNTVMREISGAIGDEPFNILPPRFDDPHPPTPPATPLPPAPAFLAPEPQPEPPAETAPPPEAMAPPASAGASATDSHVTAELPAQHRSTAELHLPSEHEEPEPPVTPPPVSLVPVPEARPPAASMPPAETAPAPPASGFASAAEPRTTGQQHQVPTEQTVTEQATSTEPRPSAGAQPPARQRRPRSPRQPKVPKAAVPTDDNP
jgi:hypothetical protein